MSPPDARMLDAGRPPAVTNGDGRFASEPEYLEWQLDMLIDALAAAVDRAEDTLALKATSRQLTFAVKTLELELRVGTRVTKEGQVLFHTLPDGTQDGSLLRVDLQQILQSQLKDTRDLPSDPTRLRSVAELPEITAGEIAGLASVAVYTVADLEGYAATPAAVAELARKANVAESRLRRWLGWPWLDRASPAAAPPGAAVVLQGGSLGTGADPSDQVIVGGRSAAIDTWSEGRIAFRVPADTAAGVLLAIVRGEVTNVLSWSPEIPDLVVRDIAMTPVEAVASEPVTFSAELINQGTGDCGPFTVAWTVDGTEERRGHGPLLAAQASGESATRLERSLPAGEHVLTFTADPDATLPDLARANGSFARTVRVRKLTTLRVGVLEPLNLEELRLGAREEHAELRGLLFRGLQQDDPFAGRPVADLAIDVSIDDAILPRARAIRTIARLAPDARFHDGSLLTARDVVEAYRAAADVKSPWSAALKSMIGVEVVDERTVAFEQQWRPKPPRPDTANCPTAFTLPLGRAGEGESYEGTGPFRVVASREQGTELRAVAGYLHGTPRIDRIFVLATSAAQLLEMLRAGQLDVAVLPYDAQLQTEFTTASWVVTALPKSAPKWLDVQSARLRERTANDMSAAWNAVFWQLAG